MENKSDGKESNLQGSRISDFEAHWSSRFLGKLTFPLKLTSWVRSMAYHTVKTP